MQKDQPHGGSRVRRASTCLVALFCSFVLGLSMVLADPPPGYYNSVDATNPTTLRTTLHNRIKDHTRFPYTSGSTDTWDILESAQQDPSNASRIIDVYRNRSHAKIGGGTGPYNREHSWPKSYGFPNDGSGNYPYTDCFQLFLCDSGYNSNRSNKPFRNCDSGCTELTTDVNLGEGGGSGAYPGNSNWTSGAFTLGSWEVWGGKRGDIARAMFYMDIRYEGGNHGITGASEPDLRLTDNESLIDSSNTGSNLSVAYMGMLSVLIQWHAQDPVDDWERNRNDVVASFQGNRNPFIDHPEWAACLYQSNCNSQPDDPPAAPTGLVANAGSGFVSLDWSDNTEPDLSGYDVYRATAAGGPFTRQNGTPIGQSQFVDGAVTNGTTYFYFVRAVDAIAQESANSNQVSATPTAAPDPPPAAPTGLSAVGGVGVVTLGWTANSEPDLSGYHVLRSTTSGGPYTQVNASLLVTNAYQDSSVANGTTYYYVVRAVDAASQSSGNSAQVSAMPQGGGGPAGPPWINEFHYDNSGTDFDEFFEIAGAAGTNLSGWSVVGYNGSNGTPYATVDLGGVIPDHDFCMGTLAFDMVGMQNGSPDGLALVNAGGTVLEFLSYEGSFVAVGGPANGMMSVDVGVAESASTPIGHSLQRAGTGSTAADFTWQPANVATRGQPNIGQVFNGCTADVTPPAAPAGLTATAGTGQVFLDWSDNTEPDLAGYNVFRSTNAGGPFSQLNGGLVASSDFLDSPAVNCTKYYYVVTARDTTGNQSANSNVASATPSVGPVADCDSNGVPDSCQSDSDNDGVIDPCDGCPLDGQKTTPGLCGCGVPDTDSDDDGTPDCQDQCPDDPNKTSPGSCGCGVADTPPDGDLTLDGVIDGRDVQHFVAAALGIAETSDLCHGDFDASGELDEGDLPGLIAALLLP